MAKLTFGEDACIPWFYPSTDDNVGKMCNPWKSQKFLQIMQKQIPKDTCSHCLPDCSTTIYDSWISYAELGKCDNTNIGTHKLCDLEDGSMNPAPWINIAKNEYRKANETLPWYLDNFFSQNSGNSRRFNNTRWRIADEDTEPELLFPSEVSKNPDYDAFKEDIGIVKFFFRNEHVLKYVKRNRMSSFDFLSQIGGSIGLAMGISMISVVEIVYWFTIRLFRNIII
jgi:hypothetical protein